MQLYKSCEVLQWQSSLELWVQLLSNEFVFNDKFKFKQQWISQSLLTSFSKYHSTQWWYNTLNWFRFFKCYHTLLKFKSSYIGASIMNTSWKYLKWTFYQNDKISYFRHIFSYLCPKIRKISGCCVINKSCDLWFIMWTVTST